MAHSIFRLPAPKIGLSAILILATVMSSAGQTQVDHQPISVKDNAALWYWPAFNQMNGEDFSQLYQDWPPIIKTQRVQSWLHTGIMNYLHRGASQRSCAWGVDFQRDGLNALLPQLGPARRLAKLAGVRAKYYFQQGDIDPAIDDLIAAMTLGRHLPNPGVLIDVMVQVSISRLSQQVLVKNLYRLDRTQLLRLQEQLADLPHRKTTAQAIVTEKYLADWFVKTVREDGAESLRDLIDEDTLSQEGFTKLIEQTGGTAEGFERLAGPMRGYYDQLQHIMTLSYDEVEPAEEALLKQITLDNNTLALLFFPTTGAPRRSELWHEDRTTMLHAMIAYRLDGPEALRRITDPYDGQPFEIEATDSTLTLRSRMPDQDGNPISVTFPGIKVKPTQINPDRSTSPPSTAKTHPQSSADRP